MFRCQVVVESAAHLVANNSDGTSDSYCVLWFDNRKGKKFKTKIVKSVNPEWKQNFIVQLDKVPSTLHVEVWDDVTLWPDTMLGRGNVSIDSQPRRGCVIPLRTKNGKGNAKNAKTNVTSTVLVTLVRLDMGEDPEEEEASDSDEEVGDHKDSGGSAEGGDDAKTPVVVNKRKSILAKFKDKMGLGSSGQDTFLCARDGCGKEVKLERKVATANEIQLSEIPVTCKAHPGRMVLHVPKMSSNLMKFHEYHWSCCGAASTVAVCNRKRAHLIAPCAAWDED